MMVIRRHAGDADTARHLPESERDPRGHRRLLRLSHSGGAVGLQGGMAASGERESSSNGTITARCNLGERGCFP